MRACSPRAHVELLARVASRASARSCARAHELRHGRQGHLRVAAVVALLAVLAGCGTPHAAGPTWPAVTDLAVVPLAATPQTPELPVAPRPVERLEGSSPVRLDIPAIGLRAGPIVDLGVDGGGVLQAPPDIATAGWSTLGPTPGAVGPAVVIGHVELDGVPGLFARLAELTPGVEVGVHRADGTEAVFVVHRVERFGRTAFPAADVYGDTAGPELRLITSGGVFDRGDGRFVDNLVVYARLVGAR